MPHFRMRSVIPVRLQPPPRVLPPAPPSLPVRRVLPVMHLPQTQPYVELGAELIPGLRALTHVVKGWLTNHFPTLFRASVPAQLQSQNSGVGRYNPNREPSRTEVIPVEPRSLAPQHSAELVDIVHFHRPDAASVRLVGVTESVMFEILRTTGGNTVDRLQIRFDNPTVSSHHARVRYYPSEQVLSVADLGSTNRTRVTLGRQPTITLDTGVQQFDTRGEATAVIKCGDATVTLYLRNERGVAKILPVLPVPVQVAPRANLRDAVDAIIRQFPAGIRGDYLPLRHDGFSANFRDAAGNIVRIQGPETLPPQVLSAIARRLGTHLGNLQARLPVSAIVHLVDASEFNTQKEFRGINGQTLYRVETGGIVTIGQAGGNTMTSMSFGANEWGVGMLLHPDTISGRMLPTGIAMTAYMLVPASSSTADEQVLRVITAIQNSLRPKLQPSHPLVTEFLDGLK